MTEADYEGSQRGDFELGGPLDDEFIPDDALPLCAKCLKPCHPLQYYCDKCDSYDAINPLTPYIGFVNIPFYCGFYFTMWHRLWGEDNKSIIVRLSYLFLIIAFLPELVIIGVPAYLICKIPQRQLRNAILAMFLLGLIVLFIFYAYTCTGRPVRRLRIF